MLVLIPVTTEPCDDRLNIKMPISAPTWTNAVAWAIDYSFGSARKRDWGSKYAISTGLFSAAMALRQHSRSLSKWWTLVMSKRYPTA